MASKTEFTEWFQDFRARWPAVGDYADRHQDTRLIDTWHETLVPFDGATLDRVTIGIIRGELEPVDNYKLGTFADEIRKRCRVLLDRDREQRDRQEVTRRYGREPMREASMQRMMAHAMAAAHILSMRGVPLDKGLGAAALIAVATLADDHTQDDERRAYERLARVQLDWEEVVAAAEKRLAEGTLQIVQKA